MPAEINLTEGTRLSTRIVLRVRLGPDWSVGSRLTIPWEERVGTATGRMEPIAC
jgi:hypothetical protein